MKTKLLQGWYIGIIILIIILAVEIRYKSYGNLLASIGTNDTVSYLDQLPVQIFSWESFTSRRIPTYVAFLKILKPEEGYNLIHISYPAMEQQTPQLSLQRGFHRVVFAQIILSITSWIILAISFAHNLRHPGLKILSVMIILAAGISPQIADWDSIVMSESLAFSLFALLAALTLELIFRFSKEGPAPSMITLALTIAWVIVVVLYSFIRDTNGIILLISAIFLIGFLLHPIWKTKIPQKLYLGIAGGLLLVFGFYLASANASHRWTRSFFDIAYDYIYPDPVRLIYFSSKGMPLEGDITPWVENHGMTSYFAYLVENPGFVFDYLATRLENPFSENLQPYFTVEPTRVRNFLVAIGNLLHPLSSVVILLDIVFTALILFFQRRFARPFAGPWSIFAIWILVGELILFTVIFYSDSASMIRHLLGVVVSLRLSVWLLLLVILDLIYQGSQRPAHGS